MCLQFREQHTRTPQSRRHPLGSLAITRPSHFSCFIPVHHKPTSQCSFKLILSALRQALHLAIISSPRCQDWSIPLPEESSATCTYESMILNAEVVKLCLLSLPPSTFVLSPGCYWSSIALQWWEAVSIYGIFRITIRPSANRANVDAQTTCLCGNFGGIPTVTVLLKHQYQLRHSAALTWLLCTPYNFQKAGGVHNDPSIVCRSPDAQSPQLTNYSRPPLWSEELLTSRHRI